jgi:hypothetical protein
MNKQGVHPVSSKEHMLNPTDIFAVAAYENKQNQKVFAAAAKKAHVSVERLAYSAMIQEYSEKSLIRIRAGNTLFTIAAFEGRVGWVRSYNGDTADNLVNNMIEFMQAARKIGFDALFAMTHTPEIVRVLKLAVRKINDPAIKTKFDSAKGIFAVSTGEKRA